MFAVSKNPRRIGKEQVNSLCNCKEIQILKFSSFCWSIGNEELHCLYFSLYLFPKVHKCGLHTSHFNETSPFAEVWWFSLGLRLWLFLHSVHFCYLILFSDFEHHRYTDSQICIDEIRLLLSSKLKLSTIFGINYLYLRFNMLVIRHFFKCPFFAFHPKPTSISLKCSWHLQWLKYMFTNSVYTPCKSWSLRV